MAKIAVQPIQSTGGGEAVLIGEFSLKGSRIDEFNIKLLRPIGDFSQIWVEAYNLTNNTGSNGTAYINDIGKRAFAAIMIRKYNETYKTDRSVVFLNKASESSFCVYQASDLNPEICTSIVNMSTQDVTVTLNNYLENGTIRIYGIE